MTSLKEDPFYPSEIAKDQHSENLSERHIYIYEQMKKCGLSSASSVLELGCGLGFITKLMAGIVKAGKIEAIDKSAKAIAGAQGIITQANVHFTKADALSYEPKYQRYDYITMFDLLDFVPERQHIELFKQASNRLHINSWLMITTPHPAAVAFDKEHHPELEAPTETIMSIEHILESTKQAGLEIYHMDTASIWRKDDYLFMVMRKQRPFQEKWVKEEMSALDKVKHRMKSAFRKAKFK